jgi:transcriptional regulator with XRE-family HTH domain
MGGKATEAGFERALRRLARNLKERRTALGLTQEDVADAAGVALRHYQKLESGEVNVTLRTLVRVTEALNTRVNELLH